MNLKNELKLRELLSKIYVDENGCWNYTGWTDKLGYGFTNFNKKSSVVHRVVYEIINGNIFNHLVLDHLCKNTSCCNPDHLEPVTNIENLRRGNTKTHCKRGHELSGDNIYRKPNGQRGCIHCRLETGRIWRKNNPEKITQYENKRKNKIYK